MTYETHKQTLEESAAKIKRVFGKAPGFEIELFEGITLLYIRFSMYKFSIKDVLKIKPLVTKKQWESILLFGISEMAVIQITEKKFN